MVVVFKTHVFVSSFYYSPELHTGTMMLLPGPTGTPPHLLDLQNLGY